MAAATATLCSLFYDVCCVLLCNERKAAYHESPTDIIHAISWIITLNDGAGKWLTTSRDEGANFVM